MEFLKEQYRLSYQFLRGPLWIYFRNTTIAFFVILGIFFIASIFFPSVLDMMLSYIQNVIDHADIVDDQGNYSAANILINNMRATALSILYGLIPFLFLPALPIGLNAAVLGSIAASYHVRSLSLLLFLSGLLPHGIFEIPALLIAFACGLYLCHTMTDNILHADNTVSFSQTVKSLFRVYITLITPLLIIASLIEAYITPICMSFFL